MKTLVFDFDGTLTVPEAEIGPFRTGMIEDLAGLTGQDFVEMEDFCRKMEALIFANPITYSCYHSGKPSSRATDPYCVWDVIIREAFRHFGVFRNVQEQNRLIDTLLFKYNYRKVNTVFKPQTKDVLKRLINKTAGVETYIVSNSNENSLRRKIRLLSRTNRGQTYKWVAKLEARTYGSAGKFQLDDNFNFFPETKEIPGLRRPVYLRRRRYYDILSLILKETKCLWSDLIVVGDMFEFDLVLPFVLGAKVGLVRTATTPQYEIDFVENTERCFMINDLYDVFHLLK